LPALAILVGGCTTQSAPRPQLPNPAPVKAAPSAAAISYAQETASAHLFEIQAAEIALARSRDPAVRNYAQSLLKDHRNLLDRASSAIERAGVTVTSPLLQQRHFALSQQLQMVAPAQFDETYRNIQVMTHMQSIELQQRYAATGDNAELRQLANEMLPALHSHVNWAQSLRIAPVPQYRARPRAGERG
jgi:putative membrane protein